MADLKLDPTALGALISHILTADGCSDDEAAVVADHLVDASLCGHPSHGVIRVVRYHQWLLSGRIKARRSLNRLSDFGAAIQLDGNGGMGQWLARQTVDIGVARARECGTALTALRRAGHVGRVGAYAEQTCAQGLISIHFVNVAGSRLVAPFGASSRCISTAPVCVGVPDPAGHDFILDFATSFIAEGKALVAARGGGPIPPGALIDENGRTTENPRALYGDTLDMAVPDPRSGAGALRTMGEHKGSGLALACELLAGALTGNGTNGPVDHEFGNGMLSIFIDPDRFDGRQAIEQEVHAYVEFVRDAKPAAGTDRVLVPGDLERERRDRGRTEGVGVPEPVMDDILRIAGDLAIPASLEHLEV